MRILISGRVNGIKVLVIGGSGFVGSHLMRYFSCHGTSSSGESGFLKLDITDTKSVSKILKIENPDLVINSSGLTNVDYCEMHQDEAIRVNGYAVENIANAVEEVGAALCHISTDYVYSGEGCNYTEEDKTGPINVYGKSKLIGEELLMGRKSIVLRISTPYGFNITKKKVTFLEFIVSNLSAKKQVKIVDDQFTTPTFLDEIPVVIEKLHNLNKTGIYNLGSSNCLSRFEFSKMVATAFNLNDELILRAKTSDIQFVARRPRNCCMINKKVKAIADIGNVKSNLERVKQSFSLKVT